MRAVVIAIGALSAAACASGRTPGEVDAAVDVDSGAIDAASPDAAEVDAGTPDAVAIDAAVIDAAVIDAQPIDAPPPIDAQPIDAPPACPGYVAVSGAPSRYRRVRLNQTWPTAKANCESDGGYLMIPETAAEATAIVNFVNPTSGSPYIWVGVSDTNDDDVWTTVFGATFNPTWGPGQPTNGGGDDYLLVTEDVQYFDWGGGQFYACECDGRTVP